MDRSRVDYHNVFTWSNRCNAKCSCDFQEKQDVQQDKLSTMLIDWKSVCYKLNNREPVKGEQLNWGCHLQGKSFKRWSKLQLILVKHLKFPLNNLDQSLQ